MKKILIILIVGTIIFINIFKNNKDNVISSQTVSVNKEKTMYKSITMEQAKEIFKTKGNYIIVDVRTFEEYSQGHIPNAINIVSEEIVKEPMELNDKNQTIYIYCRSGRRSKEASEKLVDLGYTNIVEFGGIIDWTGEIEK